MHETTLNNTLESLSQRDMVLLSEILRIEDELQRFGGMETDGERIMSEILLDQLELIIDRLSPEDDELWGHVWRVVDWLRFEVLARSEDDYSLEAIVARAEEAKGGKLTEEEYQQYLALAMEIAEVDRELSADN
ncbi:MAG TPA: hypothetical protein VK934_04945 [Fimbriimonas sp.]|nr:hypothetical protein [Fimbriimonas sp.]